MDGMRLNAFISQAGYCSRRKADELIKMGEITINHFVQKRLSYQIKEKDTVRHKKVVIKLNTVPKIYLVLNKTSGVITTAVDDKNRATVIDLLGSKMKYRVYPVGRLDTRTTGVLLLTNDGDLAQKLAHPKFEVKKVYQVTLNKELTDGHFTKIRHGQYLKDGAIKVDSITRAINKDKVRVTLHSGKNRIVRRIFESLGYTVRKLNRINFAGVTTHKLAAGEWRYLKPIEVKTLKNLKSSSK